MKQHLNRELLERLLAGRLSVAEERELFSHLVEDCEECENFMAALDDEQTGLLIEIIERANEAADLPPAAREQVLAGRPGRFLGIPLRLVPVAGIAMLAVIGFSLALVHFSMPDGGETTRIKGTEEQVKAPAVELTLGRLRTDANNATNIERIASGVKVSQGERLAFRIDTSGPCYLYLACLDSGAIEMLSPDSGRAPVHHPGGAYTPKFAGRAAAFSLKGHAGKLSFISACAVRPLQRPEDILRRAAKSLGPAEMVSFDVVDLTVTEEADEP
jgi:hypothetical protein